MRQHDFPIVLKILEGCDGVSQILHDSFSHMALHTVPHDQKAQGREAGRDHDHGEQKTRAQPGARHQRASGVSWKSWRDGL
jgi:hypothetical protein